MRVDIPQAMVVALMIIETGFLCETTLLPVNKPYWLQNLKFQAYTFTERRMLSHHSPHSWVPCLHHWNAISAVINRAALFHEWSKAPEFLGCYKVWFWGQCWRFSVIESNLLSVRNLIFGGIIRNYPHIFSRILVLVVWCNVLFSDLLWSIWGVTKFITLSLPPSAPSYVEYWAFLRCRNYYYSF